METNNGKTLLKISVVSEQDNVFEFGCESTTDIEMLTSAMIGAMTSPSFAAAANAAVLMTAANAGKLDELLELITQNRALLEKEAKKHIMKDYVDFKVRGGKKGQPLS